MYRDVSCDSLKLGEDVVSRSVSDGRQIEKVGSGPVNPIMSCRADRKTTAARDDARFIPEAEVGRRKVSDLDASPATSAC
jgi:hypothetical protein